MSPSYPFYFKRLSILLGLKFVALAAFIIAGVIGLAPDEAQYWTWSQALDFGYYSKPPGIAWQIWLGTQAFGQNEFGVRFITLLLGALQAGAVFLLAANAGLKPKICFWVGVIMAFTPLGILGSVLAITDGGMLLFWTFASVSLVSALRQGKEANPLVIGSCIMAGALFKWPIYFFWIFYLICWRLYFPQQKLLQIVQGIAVSLVGLLPSVWWNWTHDWATFRHVSSTLQGGQGHASGNFWAFFGSQAVLVSPLLFVILLISFFAWFKQRKRVAPPIFYCGLVSLSCLGGALMFSLFQKVQGNWVFFAYPTAFTLMGWKMNEWGKPLLWTTFLISSERPFGCKEASVKDRFLAIAKAIPSSRSLTSTSFRSAGSCDEITKIALLWVKAGVFLSIVAAGLFLLIPLPPAMNPFKHNQGWKALAQALTKNGYEPQKNYLISDKYQTTSLLSFYAPEQKRAFFLNLQGIRHNQYSYWPGLETQDKQATGYFVWVENYPYLKNLEAKKVFYVQELQNYFKEVAFVAYEPLRIYGEDVTKAALLFKCKDCYHLPEETSAW